MSDMAIRGAHPIQNGTAAAAVGTATLQKKPTLHDQIGTGFSQFFRHDDKVVAPPAKGSAHPRISFGERWKTLDRAEKTLVSIGATITSATLIGGVVAGAKGAIRGRGVVGALIGAGVGVVSGIGGFVGADFMLSYGGMYGTKGALKALGLRH